MPIKIECPQCHRKLTGPDSLAGKRVKCPDCQTMIQVPAPVGGTANAAAPEGAKPPPLPKAAAGAKTSPAKPAATPAAKTAKPVAAPTPATAVKEKPTPPPTMAAEAPPPPAEDVEAAAAAAFADEPVAEEDQTQIEFDCEWCGFKVRVPVSEANKRIPCPSDECRRIIKVPPPPDKKKDDWRKAGKRAKPGLKQNDLPPEDVMGGEKTALSVQARQEFLAPAAVPLTWSQRITRGVIAVMLLGGLVWGGLGISSWWVGRGAAQALAAALAAAGSKDTKADHAAILFEAAGRYYRRTGQQTKAGKPEAQAQYLRSLTALTNVKDDPKGQLDRDLLLIDLSLDLLDLAGTKEEVEAGQRVKWEEAQREAATALKAIQTPEAKMEGLHQVVRKLLAQKEQSRILPLVRQVCAEGEEKNEALARVALDLAQSGGKDPALEGLVKSIEEEVLPQYAKDKEGAAPPPASVIGLAVLQKVKDLPRTEDSDQGKALKLQGQVKGLASQGDLEQARKKTAELRDSQKKLQALVDLASAGSADKSDLEKGLDLAKSQPKANWEVYRLVELGLKAKVDPATLQERAKNIADPALRGRAELLLLRAQLEGSAKPVEDSALPAEKESLSYFVARVLQSEQNSRHGSGWGKTVQGWDAQTRPFGEMGLALGMQGK